MRKASFVGTALYMTPEIIESSISGPFTDLWCLGTIIYEMLEGKPAFSGIK
jgi:3-phosphoinositide dependent protein kinase-1